MADRVEDNLALTGKYKRISISQFSSTDKCKERIHFESETFKAKARAFYRRSTGTTKGLDDEHMFRRMAFEFFERVFYQLGAKALLYWVPSMSSKRSAFNGIRKQPVGGRA